MRVTECYIEVVLHGALNESVSVRKSNEGFYWYTTKDYNRFEQGAPHVKTVSIALQQIKDFEKESLKELDLWDYKTGKAKL